MMNPNPAFHHSHQPGQVSQPSAPPGQLLPPPVDAVAVKELLKGHGWPQGLQETFLRNLNKVPIRFFVCDNSGSMVADDGHRLVPGPRFTKCSRWSELTSTLQFHAQLARTSNAPSEFRLLNGSVPLLLGDGTAQGEENYHRLQSLLSDSPSGGTPLCQHIREVTQQITAMAPQLRAQGQKAVVVIATDGESSDGDIAQALQPLKNLPVWVIIRLCTDEDKIVDYWNNIDDQLELDMDVLDDLRGEAQEIRAVNPWLTYGEPMHRLREFGIPVKEIDLLDEKKLSLDQIRLFASLLLGGPAEDYPHPDVDWKSFEAAVKAKLKTVGPTVDPISLGMRPWIRIEKIKPSSCTIM